MQTYVITSDLKNTPEQAVIDAIHKAKKFHVPHAQCVHIIIANIIQSQKMWKSVVSIVRQQDHDEIYQKAIVFGHLPAKYADLYDDLLSHLDHLNVIDDDSIWQNIKNYLLDIYFYQACHFQNIERIAETGGGYFIETEEDHKIDSDLEIFNENNLEINMKYDQRINHESEVFEKNIQDKEIKMLNEEYDILLRNVRENRKTKNLIFVLNKN